MKNYNVIITLHQEFLSFVEAKNEEEAIKLARREWDYEIGSFDNDYVRCDVEEIYD